MSETSLPPASVPAPSAAIVAIALNTFREAIRDKILYLLLVFALLLIGASRLLSLLTVGNENKIIKDLGLSAISIFGVMIAVFVGVSLVFKEIERRTVYTLLSNPVQRWQFVAGKFFGLIYVLLMNVALMTAGLFVVLLLRGESPWSLLPAILLILVELAIVTAFALLFSSFTNPILSAVWTFAAYVTGHLAWSMKMLKEKVGSGWGQTLCDAVYAVLPPLDRMNIKSEVVHGIPLAPGYVGYAVAYGCAYAILVLVAACIVFQRRDFN